MSHHNRRRASGFTLIETLIAVTILTAGLLALGGLVARTAATADSSRYMSTQSLLVSEKLDDLNRLPATDPQIAVPAGTTAGSLQADITQDVTVGAITESVDYFDTVEISSGTGSMTESSTSTDAAGNTVYTTTTHKPDGTISATTSNAAPATNPSTLTFKRRWVIEKDTPIVGVRRITVAVTLNVNPPAAPFQMSMVRP